MGVPERSAALCLRGSKLFLRFGSILSRAGYLSPGSRLFSMEFPFLMNHFQELIEDDAGLGYTSTCEF